MFDFQHVAQEEYLSCILGYDADTDVYQLIDICYEMVLGNFKFDNLIGCWLFINEAYFHDSCTLHAVTELLSDLNTKDS